MSGLFRRLSSRRSAGPEGTEPAAQAEPGAADTPTSAPADAGGHQSLLNDPAADTRMIRGDEQAEPDDQTRVLGPGDTAAAGPDDQTRVLRPGETGAAATGDGATAEGHQMVRLTGAETPHHALAPIPQQPAAPLPVSDLPAGLDPDELASAPPSSARRSRLRRRVAFLRAARELLLRDLGGFVYEVHRTAGDIEAEAHRRLREIKLARLTRLDTELHELELRLDDVRRHVLVREPGVGGECPQCGELFGSDAHFCSHCGLPLTESARKATAREAPPVAAAPAEPAAAAPVADQPTEDYTPPDAEFEWPRYDAATGGETAAGEGAVAAGEPAGSGAEAATADGEVEGEVADGEPAGSAEGEGETATAREDAPHQTGAAAGEDAAPAGGEAPTESLREDGDADANGSVLSRAERRA